MRFYLDTEFIERGPDFPVTLISIAVVAEDGRAFYKVSADFDPDTASDWVKANVLPHIEGEDQYTNTRIASELRDFIGNSKPEFWGYYADYDWVVTAQLFGTMMDLPEGWPMYCRDLQQLVDQIGNPPLQSPEGEHNALADAKWNMQLHDVLLASLKHQDEQIREAAKMLTMLDSHTKIPFREWQTRRSAWLICNALPPTGAETK